MIDKLSQKLFILLLNTKSFSIRSLLSLLHGSLRFRIYLQINSSTSKKIHHSFCKFFFLFVFNVYKRNTRCACPRELFEILAEEYGEGKAFDFMKVMNEKAPLTVRVNVLKTTRDEVMLLITTF